MNRVGFFVSWIVSSVVMFIASYVWHGLFTTDYSRLSYPISIFLAVATIVYLLIGFAITKFFEFDLLPSLRKKPLALGTLIGMAAGIIIYFVAIVIGVSFSSTITMQSMLMDVTWQVLEQGLGGLSVGIAHRFIIPEYFIKIE